MEGHTYEVQFIIPRLPAHQWQYELENPEIQIVKLQTSGNIEQLGGLCSFYQGRGGLTAI